MMNNQIALMNAELTRDIEKYSINETRRGVDYSINEIEHHVTYKRKYKNSTRNLSLDDNAFLLGNLKALKERNNQIFEGFKTIFSNSQTARICFYNSHKLYEYIIGDIKRINEKIKSNFGNLLLSIQNDFRVTENLSSIDFTSELESFQRNLDNFENEIKTIEKFAIDENIEMREYFGTRLKVSEYRSFKEEIKEAEENLSEIESKLLDISFKHSEITAGIKNKITIVDYYNKALELKKNLINNLRESIESLNDAKLKSAAEKIEILKLSNEKNDLIEKNQKLEFQRINQDETFLKKANEITDAQSALIHEIKTTKNFTKIHHIIFVLDESSSMSGLFENVRENVKSVITNRRKVPLTKEKVSVIKFNENATIQVLNADLLENIEIGTMSGGGTSFVAALSKLEEVLSEINGEKYVPTVFFLSDGYGEPKDLVLNKSREVFGRFKTLDILFFSVGFGKNVDKETLEEMNKVFNRGSSILKIGDELCSLYVNAENNQQLKKAFNSYNKFFSYQKNLITTKQEMLNEHLKNLTLSNQQIKKEIDNFSGYNQQYFNQRTKEAKKNALNLENLDNVYDETLKQLDQNMVKAKQDTEELIREKKIHETDLNMLKIELELIENKETLIKNDYDTKSKSVRNLKDKENEKYLKAIQNADDHLEKNFNIAIQKLEDLGVNTNDDFRRYYQNFQIGYNNFENNIIELSNSGNKILDNFKSIKGSLNGIKSKFHYLGELFSTKFGNSFSVLNKIVNIIKEKNNIGQNIDIDEAFQSILINSLNIKRERERNEFDQALEFLKSDISIEKILGCFLKGSSDILEDKKTELDDKVQKLTDKISDIIEESEKNILKQQIDEIKNKRRFLLKREEILKKIINKLQFLTGIAKEEYIKIEVINTLKENYYIIQRFFENFFIPLIE